MGKQRSYKVIGPHEFLGTPPGGTLEAAEDVREVQFGLDIGALELVEGKADDGEDEKVACPACVEQKLKRPPKFDAADTDAIAEHYADKHPALVVPDLREEQ